MKREELYSYKYFFLRHRLDGVFKLFALRRFFVETPRKPNALKTVVPTSIRGVYTAEHNARK